MAPGDELSVCDFAQQTEGLLCSGGPQSILAHLPTSEKNGKRWLHHKTAKTCPFRGIWGCGLNRVEVRRVGRQPCPG